jgi:hypothetical protein
MAGLGKALLIGGLLGFAAAVAWWYAFYEQFLGADVKKASECFYYTTELCSLGGIVEAAGDIPAYSPAALWIAVAMLVVGTFLAVRAPRRQ